MLLSSNELQAKLETKMPTSPTGHKRIETYFVHTPADWNARRGTASLLLIFCLSAKTSASVAVRKYLHYGLELHGATLPLYQSNANQFLRPPSIRLSALSCTKCAGGAEDSDASNEKLLMFVTFPHSTIRRQARSYQTSTRAVTYIVFAHQPSPAEQIVLLRREASAKCSRSRPRRHRPLW